MLDVPQILEEIQMVGLDVEDDGDGRVERQEGVIVLAGFHDYRVDGLDRELLNTFIAELGWEALLNTRGTTWRKLDESVRAGIDNADAAAALMLEMPAIIKRPLLCAPGQPMLLGFSDSSYQQFFHEV